MPAAAADVEIRPTDPDSAAARALIAASDAYLATLYPAESNHLESVAALAQPGVRFLGAWRGDALIGCGAVKRQADAERYGEIKRVYVLPAERGRGVSKALMRALEAELLASGIGLARLETGIRQAEALALYRRLGYHERGPFGDYAPDPLSVFLEKRLGRPDRGPPPDGLRAATLADADGIAALIARSARGLSGADYSDTEIEAALAGAFGLDTRLIEDGTYYVVTAGGGYAACGGWSRRRTLYGSDRRAGRDDALLDPAVDAARIRAFFVDPAQARRGLGRRLLAHCEAAAAAEGFRRYALLATLPGVRLYAACGYVAGPPERHRLGDGSEITFVPMSKGAPPGGGG